MLVFSRRRDETIMIGDGIQVRVLRIGKDGVRLGVAAPPHVQVHRQEIYDQIREANKAAADSPAATASIAERLKHWRAHFGAGGNQ
jgi:carbon storage regulator